MTLADNLGIKYHIVPISAVYDRFMKETEPLFEGDFHWDTTQENLQARIRGTILMLYSNRHRALLLNTTNKSELSMGYGTLYGDLCGALMVIADLYKTEVYEMAAYINRDGEVIPSSTITKAPSAELKEGQKDTDSLPHSTASTRAAAARNRFCRKAWTRGSWTESSGSARPRHSRSTSWHP